MSAAQTFAFLGFCIIAVFLWTQRNRSYSFTLFGEQNESETKNAKKEISAKKEIFFSEEIFFDFLTHFSSENSAPTGPRISPQDCTMTTCFSRKTQCKEGNFRVFIYPENENENKNENENEKEVISPIYKNILFALRHSRYLTEQPEEACLFILGLDTIDRDRLSEQFGRDFNEKLRSNFLVQKFWNEGRNHVIFNLYSGTFPDYVENDLGFDVGYAILAKASMSVSSFRHNFDVSLPLFHNSLPVRGEDSGFSVKSSRFPEMKKKYLLSFKGKRYLYGIGSDSRNFLYHIHNDKDIIILTTCLHGKQSKQLRDKRCDQDDEAFSFFDYENLLENSTFCLVPRGRRLGSFRFLEALQAGCIPVVLSNGWELPFSEIIDWKKAIFLKDEKLLTQIPTFFREIRFETVLKMRQQTQLLWRQYFSSIEKIVLTTLEIIRNRLGKIRRSKEIWNNWPAISLSLVPYLEDSDFLSDFRKNVKNPRLYQEQNFTAIVTLSERHNLGTSFVRLLKTLNRLPYVQKVIVLSPWQEATVQAVKGWTWIRVPVKIVSTNATPSEMISVLDKHVSTNCVTLLTDDCDSTWEEFEFAFHVWKSNPERLVGFHSSSHFWDEAFPFKASSHIRDDPFHSGDEVSHIQDEVSHIQDKGSHIRDKGSQKWDAWRFSDKLTNEYSMVALKDVFVHVQYYRLMWHYRNRIVPKLSVNCTDILLNFIVASVTRLPPMKVAGKTKNVCLKTNFDFCLNSYSLKNGCLNYLTDVFGYMPLVRSSVVYNPLLYKDNVSTYRKKYRHLEQATL